MTSIGREKIWTRNVFLLSAPWPPPPRLRHNPLLRHIGSQLGTPSSKLGLGPASMGTLCANTFRAKFQLLVGFVACIFAHWVPTGHSVIKIGSWTSLDGDPACKYISTFSANVLRPCVQIHEDHMCKYVSNQCANALGPS